MIKNWRVILFFAFSCIWGKVLFAQFTVHQNREIDSLNKLIKEAKHDTTVVRAYVELSEILYVSNIDTLKYYGEKSVSIIEKKLALNPSMDEERSFLETKAIALGNIGYVHHVKGDYLTALTYYDKSLKIAEELGVKKEIALMLNNIGSVYTNQGDQVKALEYYNRSLIIEQEIGGKKAMMYLFNNIGLIYKMQGNIVKGLEYYNKSLRIREEIGDKRGVAISLSHIARINFKKGDLVTAKELAIQSLDIAKKIGYPEDIMASTDILSKIYQEEKSWGKAFNMQKLYTIMNDSIRNENTEKEVIKQQANYEIEKKELALKNKEKEVELLSSKNEVQELKLNRNRILATLSTIALALAIILIIVSYKGYKKNQVINKLLSKQNEEKNSMLQEIHHRVKNNLQVVNTLLRLQSKEIEDENIVAMFTEAQNRVVSMALLHEKMYRADDLQHIDVQDHITLLVEDLLKTYVVRKNITSEIKIENAVIGDDGIGMDEKIKKNGLGVKLTQTFIKQLKGTIEKLERSGTMFKIVFEKID